MEQQGKSTRNHEQEKGKPMPVETSVDSEGSVQKEGIAEELVIENGADLEETVNQLREVEVSPRLLPDENEVPLRQTTGPSVFIGSKNDDISLGSEIERFQDTMKNAILPVRSFTLKLKVEHNKTPIFENFMSKYVTEATVLKIYIDKFADLLEMLPQYNSIPPFEFRKLEKMELYCNDVGFREALQTTDVSFPSLPVAIFFGATCLQELAVTIDNNANDTETELSALAMSELFRCVPSTVKKLEVKIPFWRNSYFNSLTLSKIQLESLGVHVKSILWGDSSPNEFFRKQSDTLTGLILKSEGNHFFRNECPPLKKLETMVLLAGLDFYKLKPYKATNCPSLTKLDLTFCHWQLVERIPAEERPCNHSVKMVVMPMLCYPATLIETVMKIFPKVLNLQLSSPENIEECLQQVFLHCKTVECLSVAVMPTRSNCGVDGDSLLSGISAKDCVKLRKSGRFEAKKLNQLRCKRSILDLKCLKSFHFTTLLPDSIFSDLTFRQFLSNSIPLEVLQWEAPETKVSPTVLKQLQKRLLALKLTSNGYEHLGFVKQELHNTHTE